MKLIYPKTISLISSTVAVGSDGHAEWSSGTTYGAGTKVMVTTANPHKIYESLQASNTNHSPATSPTWWQDQGGTNRWKMFDEFLDTQTIDSSPIEVEIDASNCDRFMLFNMDAHQVDIELTDNDTSTAVQTETYDLSNGDGSYKLSMIEPIYIYSNATLKITITSTGTVKIGMAAVGWSTEIGVTNWGVKPGFVDYSIKDTDGFGYTYLSVGAWAKEINSTLTLELGETDSVFEDLISARGKVVGAEFNDNGDDFECLRAMGFFKKWKMKLSDQTPSITTLDIDFQGII